MLKTDGLCRPENHYGAYLSGNWLPTDLPVDFLNIPGEVFNISEKRIDLFFQMKKLIEGCEDLFYLSKWSSPSGHVVELIVTKEFNIQNFSSLYIPFHEKRSRRLTWGNIRYDLNNCKYVEKSRKNVTGKYIFRHITELNIDSLLLTLESCWQELKGNSGIEWSTLDGEQVIDYFYPLSYCNLANNMVLCDRLDQKTNIIEMEDSLKKFYSYDKSVSRHFYLAFRAADTIILKKPEWYQEYKKILRGSGTSLKKRNVVYSRFLTHLQQAIEKEDPLLKDIHDHIQRIAGDKFNNLLNYVPGISELLHSNQSFLPPNVYFTATPIDADFCIYQNSMNNVIDATRFYNNDGNRCRSFTREVLDDMSRHQCFGTLQLLTDILRHNDILPFGHDILSHHSLKYNCKSIFLHHDKDHQH